MYELPLGQYDLDALSEYECGVWTIGLLSIFIKFEIFYSV